MWSILGQSYLSVHKHELSAPFLLSLPLISSKHCPTLFMLILHGVFVFNLIFIYLSPNIPSKYTSDISPNIWTQRNFLLLNHYYHFQITLQLTLEQYGLYLHAPRKWAHRVQISVVQGSTVFNPDTRLKLYADFQLHGDQRP